MLNLLANKNVRCVKVGGRRGRGCVKRVPNARWVRVGGSREVELQCTGWLKSLPNSISTRQGGSTRVEGSCVKLKGVLK